MKTVKIDELAHKVSKDLNSSESDARAVLERTVETIRKELQRGNGIELNNFVTIHIRQGDPIATNTQAGGKLGLPSARIIQIDLDESLRKIIEGAGLYQIMLIVPKKNFFTGVMASRLASALRGPRRIRLTRGTACRPSAPPKTTQRAQSVVFGPRLPRIPRGSNPTGRWLKSCACNRAVKRRCTKPHLQATWMPENIPK